MARNKSPIYVFGFVNFIYKVFVYADFGDDRPLLRLFSFFEIKVIISHCSLMQQEDRINLHIRINLICIDPWAAEKVRSLGSSTCLLGQHC